MKIFKISIFFFVLLFAQNVGAVCYEATGFGTTNANGIYTEIASDKFINDNGFYYLGCAFKTDLVWQYVCINSPDNTDGDDYYHKNTPWPYTGSGFTVGSLGGSPAGTISEVTCPAPDPGTSTTTLSEFGLWGTITTSTQALITENGVPLVEIVLGIMFVFFALFFLAVGLSRSFRRLLKKY